jgi:hypothetical protein
MKENSQSIFVVEGLQPSWLGTESDYMMYEVVSMLSAPLIFGPIFWIMYGRFFGPVFGLLMASLPVLFCAKFSGLIEFERYAPDPLRNISLSVILGWSWKGFRDGVRSATIWILVFALLFSLLALCSGQLKLNYEMITWLALWLIIWLTSALVFGLISGTPHKIKPLKSFPNEHIVLSLRNFLIPFVVTFLIFDLICVVCGLVHFKTFGIKSLHNWLVVGLYMGLISGLVVGLNRGGSDAIKHYALRLILWLRGYTSLEFVRFLDYCATLGFLKRVGFDYIFIHRMMLEYFAEITSQDSPPKSE